MCWSEFEGRSVHSFSNRYLVHSLSFAIGIYSKIAFTHKVKIANSVPETALVILHRHAEA